MWERSHQHSPKPSRTVTYAAVFDGSDIWMALFPRFAPWATNMASAAQTLETSSCVRTRHAAKRTAAHRPATCNQRSEAYEILFERHYSLYESNNSLNVGDYSLHNCNYSLRNCNYLLSNQPITSAINARKPVFIRMWKKRRKRECERACGFAVEEATPHNCRVSARISTA